MDQRPDRHLPRSKVIWHMWSLWVGDALPSAVLLNLSRDGPLLLRISTAAAYETWFPTNPFQPREARALAVEVCHARLDVVSSGLGMRRTALTPSETCGRGSVGGLARGLGPRAFPRMGRCAPPCRCGPIPSRPSHLSLGMVARSAINK